MSIINKPPQHVKREYELEEPVALVVEKYATFIDSTPDHVVNVLHGRVGVADAIPMIGEEMPQRRRDHAVLAGQGTQHRRPDPEIAQRAVDADQRRAIAGALADIEIGHVIAVDVYCLHGIS